ncbi:MAG: class II aldolase/adducin family protein [Candidatus ainarchaeum sp.]|nr:class II aldolase/adducin family protein [Candidatus ainarchaeum sp.]
MEGYAGVKFEVKALPGRVGSAELLEADRLVARFMQVSGGEGNISVRKGGGFLIKRTGARMTKLMEEDVVFVKKIAGGVVHAVGGTPSSESRMHWEIYRARKDANVILHFHDDRRLGEKFGAEIGPFPYGTAELAEAAGAASRNSDRIKIIGHGFVVVAKGLEDLAALLSAISSAR